MPISNPSLYAPLLSSTIESDLPLVLPGGRLTLNQSNPTADVTNGTTVYYVPYVHSWIPVWNSERNIWNYLQLPPQGVGIGILTAANANVDIYATGTPVTGLAILRQGWVNDAGRLVPISMNGLQCLDYGAGANPRFSTYLGTVRTSGTDAALRFQDSQRQRHIWNAYNRVDRPTQFYESANSWSYLSSTYRILNNNSANRLEFLTGAASTPLLVSGRFAATTPANTSALCGIAVNGNVNGSDQGLIGPNSEGETSVTIASINPLALGLSRVELWEAVLGSSPATIYGFGRYGLRVNWSC